MSEYSDIFKNCEPAPWNGALAEACASSSMREWCPKCGFDHPAVAGCPYREAPVVVMYDLPRP